jgi:hypothetical protein
MPGDALSMISVVIGTRILRFITRPTTYVAKIISFPTAVYVCTTTRNTRLELVSLASKARLNKVDGFYKLVHTQGVQGLPLRPQKIH